MATKNTMSTIGTPACGWWLIWEHSFDFFRPRKPKGRMESNIKHSWADIFWGGIQADDSMILI